MEKKFGKLIIKTLFILTIGLTIISCKENTSVINYCEILADDQNNVNWDKSDTAKFENDKRNRSAKIMNNFNLIIAETKQNGFPKVDLNYSPNDSCKSKAVMMTMIHAAQISPNLFFNSKYSKLFKNEIDKGNLDNEILKRSSIICFKTEEICSGLKTEIENALDMWNVPISIMNDANFIKCE